MEKQLDYDVIPADIFAEAIVENGVLKIEGLEEEKNLLELAVMIPKDLTWTESEKNVILAYNIF